MFIPTTQKETKKLQWHKLDIILVTGDTYIDSPYIGVALLGKLLINEGYKVGIIAQPNINSFEDIKRLGEPKLFWGISAGSIDSMVANRTALGKKRKRDDYTPGGINNKRPDRALIAYSNLIRKYFKKTVPLVLGGIEASLRRIAHYDMCSDKIRRSVLLDAKADYLVFGMAERSILELAACLKAKKEIKNIRGLSYICSTAPREAIELPSFEKVASDKNAFIEMFHIFYKNNDPLSASKLIQKYDKRFLVQNKPAIYLSQRELDFVYALDYERDVHPYYKAYGEVKALETIRFSIATHRGCYGECNFCAIAVHEGRQVRWRSEKSILREAKVLTEHPKFKGIIKDVGGPTANMYGFECEKKIKDGVCLDKRCMSHKVCSTLKVNHNNYRLLLQSLRKIKGVKKVFIASGLRYDLIEADKKNGKLFLEEIVTWHTSGQMKIAPEHSEREVLRKMGKPSCDFLIKFRADFNCLTQKINKKQFLTYYIIAAHPGCRKEDMQKLRNFAVNKLKMLPQQVQIFTPTPSTYSTLMYYTEKDVFSGKKCFVEKSFKGKEEQKNILIRHLPTLYKGKMLYSSKPKKRIKKERVRQ